MFCPNVVVTPLLQIKHEKKQPNKKQKKMTEVFLAIFMSLVFLGFTGNRTGKLKDICCVKKQATICQE